MKHTYSINLWKLNGWHDCCRHISHTKARPHRRSECKLLGRGGGALRLADKLIHANVYALLRDTSVRSNQPYGQQCSNLPKDRQITKLAVSTDRTFYDPATLVGKSAKENVILFCKARYTCNERSLVAI